MEMQSRPTSATKWRDIAWFWKGLSAFSEVQFERRLEYVADGLRALVDASHVMVVVERRIGPDDSELEGLAPIFSRDFGPGVQARDDIRREWMANEPHLGSDPILEMTARGAGVARAIPHRIALTPEQWADAPVRRLLEQLGLEDRLGVIWPLNRDIEVVYCLDRPTGAPIYEQHDADRILAALQGLQTFTARFVLRHGLMPGQRQLDATELRAMEALLGERPEAAIAAELGVGPAEFDSLAQTIYDKLAVDDRISLVSTWMRAHEWIDINPTVAPKAAAGVDDEDLGDLADADGDQILARVRSAIDAALAAGQLELEAVAERLGTSPRALQRALRSTDTHFRELVDDARRERVAILISRPWLNLTEVAHQLGYKQVSSFNRAVKRWTGKTPGRLQELLRKDMG